ncbi:Valine--tRNA ligase [Armadillidium nasatum]|uniref:valine--tRNA ligase n=1 Tax=Armadillidium nasatum TaxID=96803 RepID=A0A5N5TF55_9CRUS|nr:Valine--tRNA ligase [Armadillidium nasatum]
MRESVLVLLKHLQRFFNDGLIYRGVYMINWCSTLQSAISDFEVDHIDIEGPTPVTLPGYKKPVMFGYLYEVKYKVLDLDETVTVCTTRPETILGDTAVMVHPEDPRYKHLHGRFVCHPFNGKAIPIITDFQVGMPRFVAREKILDHLSNLGLYDGSKKPHSMKLPLCSRSGDVIEHRLKEQWFLKTKKMTEDALKAISEGVELEKIKVVQQDTDVLDTWFSSGLLPFVINGWPHWGKKRKK